MVDHTTDEALAAVTAADTGVDSLVALIAKLKQDVIDAGKNAGLTAAQQTAINSVFDTATNDAAKIQAALSA
jgi:hypothetical protein